MKFDLTGFYETMDARLLDSGEPWDLRWIRDRFAESSPAPERRKLTYDADRPFSPQEIEQYEAWRRAMGGCGHRHKCGTRADCMQAYIQHRRGLAVNA